MNPEVKAKLDEMSPPCSASWVLSNGMNYTGTIISRGPGYIEVQTEQGDTFRQADADLAYVTIL